MRFMTTFVYWAGFIALSTIAYAEIQVSEPQNGDLLFQENDNGEFNKAVSKVTEGYGGMKINHVGLIEKKDDGKLYIIESKTKVQEIPLSEFLNRSMDENGNPKVLIGRLIPKFQNLIPSAINFASKQIGKPYNDSFNAEDTNSFYCSQLIYEAFKYANNGVPFFKTSRMTFKEPGTDETYPVWLDYFRKLHIPVPEGKSGTNPGALSKSESLEIYKISR